MRKIIVTSHITLDGVMQAALSSDEDPSGGFRYGGWAAPLADATSGKAVQKEMNQPVDYLLGRKTFALFASFWPQHAPMWPGINENAKYVLSKTIKHADWKNTVFLESLSDIQQLKGSVGPDLQVWGSSELTHLLLENGLVDELHLRIFPLILGKGKRLFASGSVPSVFSLTDQSITSKGVIMAHYQRANAVVPSQPIQSLIDHYLHH